jgi:hypothetical protein
MKQLAHKFVCMSSLGSWNILRKNKLIAQCITIIIFLYFWLQAENQMQEFEDFYQFFPNLWWLKTLKII